MPNSALGALQPKPPVEHLGMVWTSKQVCLVPSAKGDLAASLAQDDQRDQIGGSASRTDI